MSTKMQYDTTANKIIIHPAYTTHTLVLQLHTECTICQPNLRMHVVVLMSYYNSKLYMENTYHCMYYWYNP